MARKSRHYRAVEREVKNKPLPANGVFIPNEKKMQILSLSISAGFLAFISGLTIGFLISKNDD